MTADDPLESNMQSVMTTDVPQTAPPLAEAMAA
jgi:hypothetical protein